MRDRTPIVLVAVTALLTGGRELPLLASQKPTPSATASPKPTPSPTAKTQRKLGGGSFGTPPAATPAAGEQDGGSLADIARKAQESSPQRTPSRRIVITNESLRRSEPTPGSTSITLTGTADSKPVVRVPPGPTPTAAPIPEYRDASGRTEAEWRDRAASARERVARAETDLEAARNEERRLENDFYAWSDGNYRERVIRPAWDQARERVRSLEEEVVKAREDLDALEEEARKSGTPPGWLR